MATIARQYTFTDGQTAYGSEVETEIDTIYDAWNNHDGGTSAWTNVKVSASAANPVDITGSAATTELSINNTASDGDPIVSFELSSTAVVTMGIDDSDSDKFKIGSTGIATSTVVEIIPTAAPHLKVLSDDATTEIAIDNTATDGDPVMSYMIGGTAVVTMGIDDSDSDKFKIGSTGIATSTVIEIIPTAAPHLKVISDDATTEITIDNTGTDSDPILTFKLSGTTTYAMGIDDSASDAFKIGTSSIDTNTALQIPTSGAACLFAAGTSAAPGIGFIAEPGLGLFRSGIDQLTITAGSQAMAVFDDQSIELYSNSILALYVDTNQNTHVMQAGNADVELEVSDGATTGGGTIHRAASAAHSRRSIKSDINYLSVSEEVQAYNDVKSLKPVTYKYKKLKNDVYIENPTAKVRRGLIYEDAPESIKEKKADGTETGAIVIDERILNLEMAMKEVIRRLESI